MIFVELVKGEMYPPSVKETSVKMKYPSSVPWDKQLAFGHELFGLVPGLMMYGTIWLREHNRVCDILKGEHPTWSDEQLFQTTRLILMGTATHHFPHSGLGPCIPLAAGGLVLVDIGHSTDRKVG